MCSPRDLTILCSYESRSASSQPSPTLSNPPASEAATTWGGEDDEIMEIPAFNKPRAEAAAGTSALPDNEEIAEIPAASFEYEDTLKTRPSAFKGRERCKGYALVLPNGQSAIGLYPFGIHRRKKHPTDVQAPWDIHTRGDLIAVTARNCTGFASKDSAACSKCHQLSLNPTLKGILDRMENGMKPGTTLQWYGIDGLHAKIHEKDGKIAFHRLESLNQAKTLLRKAAALTDHKRFLMAVSSDNIQRLDRVISIGLRQKKGIKGLLESVYAAEQGLYKVRSFSEKEARHAILVWRLGGNRIAEINHRAKAAPSVTYLRKHSKIPPLVASPGQPTIEEVQKNAKATIDSLLEVLEARFGDTPVQHAVLMYDELKTESRIRYDLLSNHFLGVCREHAHHVSLKFVNEGDMLELFRAIDDGQVHCAGEVRVLS